MSVRRALLSLATCIVALSIGQANAASEVGVAAAVNQSALGVPPGASGRTITLGDNVIHNEHVTTGGEGLVQILLVDGTAFTVGPNSDLTIDDFVYDPNAGTAKVAATLTRGVFRFIGGRTSKTGGATIKTPVGTAGIRGGIFVYMQQSDDQGGSIVVCVYAQPSCSVNGQSFAMNEYVTVNAAGSVSPPAAVTPEIASIVNNRLAGPPGTSGGSNKSSQVAAIVNGGGGSTSGQQEPRIPPLDYTIDTLTTTTFVEDTNSIPTVPTTTTTTPPPTYTHEPIRLRLLTAPSTYETDSGNTISSEGGEGYRPGELGLVGGDEDHDQAIDLTLATSGSQTFFSGSGAVPSVGNIELPVYFPDHFSTILMTNFASPFGSLDGVIYANQGFAFYEMAPGVDGSYATAADEVAHRDVTNPVYALYGEPTDFTDVFTSPSEGDTVRRYTFTQDPIQGVPVPFARADVLAASFTDQNSSVGDLYVVEPPGGEGGSVVHMMQAWLQIDGAGAAQQSGVGVVAGVFSDQGEDEFGFTGGRRGSYRSASDEGSFDGTVKTLAGADGGTQVFGPDGANFVLSSDVSNNDPFADTTIDGATNFSTVHVASLADDNVAIGSRTTRTLTGYSAGVVNVDYQSGCSAPGVGCDSSMTQALATGRPEDGQGIVINFDAGSDRVGGNLAVQGVTSDGSGSLTLEFGQGPEQGSGDGQSTFVDDNIYAALESAYPQNTTAVINVTNDNGTVTTSDDYDVPEVIYQREGDQAKTYVVSADAVAISNPAFMGGASFCSACDFIEWGWWGTNVRFQDYSSANDSVSMTAHLGTWVAGDIVLDTDEDFGSLTGLATYSGHAVGTVVATIGEGTYQYVAGGDFDFTWDFGHRIGVLAFNNFDGRDFGGVAVNNTDSSAGFTGYLFGSGLTGTASGAFVYDGSNSRRRRDR